MAVSVEQAIRGVNESRLPAGVGVGNEWVVISLSVAVDSFGSGAMGTITDLRAVRRAPGRFISCEDCGERHPIIKLAGGSVRCVTAFSADGHWFCRNRGCRAAWLKEHAPQKD